MPYMKYKWEVFTPKNEIEREGIVDATSVNHAKRASIQSSGLITLNLWGMDRHPIIGDNMYVCEGTYGHKLYLRAHPI